MTLTDPRKPALPVPFYHLAPAFLTGNWNKFAGEAGAFVWLSTCGRFEAMAEPLADGWQFWLVRTSDGATIREERVCAS